MTRKERKPLDSLAEQFVYGQSEVSLPQPEPSLSEPVAAEPQIKEKSNLMTRLTDTPEREATIRLTVDLPESMHKRLSIFAAQTGKKKAEIVRILLEDALGKVE